MTIELDFDKEYLEALKEKTAIDLINEYGSVENYVEFIEIAFGLKEKEDAINER